ncbi:hypothetical protein ABZZ46_31055 [Streptomyces rochei]
MDVVRSASPMILDTPAIPADVPPLAEARTPPRPEHLTGTA